MSHISNPGPALRGILAAIAALAIAVPALIVHLAPAVTPHRAAVAALRRVVPEAELPPVEPVAFENLDPDDARAFNATVPFVEGPNPAARPFRLAGDSDQRARAIDCMAAAVLYEAGDDPKGQRAVAQVVINRVRHPAFPKTICGVVFQGSERSTGCQFTFTCDGALLRHHWLDAQWARARQIATAALTGAVFRPVGYATHYHTDWVVPYWQSSLDKIAAVNTHLFFRWTGWWGTPPAFNRHVSTDEPVIAALAAYSEAHRNFAAASADTTALDTTMPAGDLVHLLERDRKILLVSLDKLRNTPDGFTSMAANLCGDRPYCMVMGWTDKSKTPATLPLELTQISAMSFSYLRDRTAGFEKALWNCREFHRPNTAQCMKRQVFMPVPREPDSAPLEGAPSAIEAPPGKAPLPDGLSGVRRKNEDQTTKIAPPVSALNVASPAG